MDEGSTKRWLTVLLKALSVAAGPAGAPGEAVLQFLNDARIDELEAELKTLFLEGSFQTRDKLDAILGQLQDFQETREQILSGLYTIINLLARDQKRIATPQQLSDIVRPQFVLRNVDTFMVNGFLTEVEFKTELVRQFGRGIREFKMLLEDAGFETAQLSEGIPGEEIIHEFYRKFVNGCNDTQKEKILRVLAERRGGSRILQRAHRLMIETLRGNS